MCAIKVLKPLSRIAPTESAYERIEKRFIAEAKRAKALSHRSICEVLDFGFLGSELPTGRQDIDQTWEGLPFYSMKLLGGSPLNKLLQGH
jgi:hypothetical protein